MKLDKETLIAIIVCVGLMLAWPTIAQKMGWMPEEEVAEETATAETAGNLPASQGAQALPAPAKPAENIPAAQTLPAPAKPAENIPAAQALPAPAKPADGFLAGDAASFAIDPVSGGIRSIRFLGHRRNDLQDNIVLESGQIPGLFTLTVPGMATTADAPVKIADGTAETVRTLTSPGGSIRVSQHFALGENFTISCRYTLENLGKAPLLLSGASVSGGAIAPWHLVSGDKIRTVSHRLDLITADGSHKDIGAKDDDEDFFFAKPPKVRWAAVSNKYFCALLRSDDGDFTLWQSRFYTPDEKGKDQPVIAAGASLPDMILQPGVPALFSFTAYVGPKSSESLSRFVPGGEKVMHLAWGPLNYLARFLLWILNLLHALCGSYGASIILLTLLVRLVFYPLTSKGNESMRKMQKVQPLFKELKEKYKDNPQLLNQKMTELYRKEGINPFAGCLPILLQIPIFFALYAMLDNAIALRHVSFLWCRNLAAADTVFSIPLGFTLPFFNIDAIPVNPLVLMMTALMVVQQKMSSVSMDPAQKKMMAMMPVVMLLFLYDLPSGLTLYWTVSNLFSIIQLWLQQKRSRTLQAADGQGKKP